MWGTHKKKTITQLKNIKTTLNRGNLFFDRKTYACIFVTGGMSGPQRYHIPFLEPVNMLSDMAGGNQPTLKWRESWIIWVCPL